VHDKALQAFTGITGVGYNVLYSLMAKDATEKENPVCLYKKLGKNQSGSVNYVGFCCNVMRNVVFYQYIGELCAVKYGFISLRCEWHHEQEWSYEESFKNPEIRTLA
jgi:hypothetical protein